MKSKYSKPNLVDSIIKKTVSNELSNKNDNKIWESTVQGFKQIYNSLIKPHWFMILVILSVVIFLFYRWKIVKTSKTETRNITNIPVDNFKNIHKPTKHKSDYSNEYARLLLDIYDQHKEDMIEYKATEERPKKDISYSTRR